MKAGCSTQQPPVEMSGMAARLCASERARVEAMRSAGVSAEDIAGMLGRHRSTIYRELGRCGGAGGYAAASAAAQDSQARSGPLSGLGGAGGAGRRIRSALISPRRDREYAQRRSIGPRTAAAGSAPTRGRTCRGGAVASRAAAALNRPVRSGTVAR